MYRYVHGGDIYSDPSLKCNKDMLDYSANINPLGIPAGIFPCPQRCFTAATGQPMCCSGL